MNPLDSAILTFLNQFAGQWPTLDLLVNFATSNNLVKGGPVAALLWWAWFMRGEADGEHRDHLVTTLVACFVAIAIARILAKALPFRLRPMHNAEAGFVLPYSVSRRSLEGWSAFPSDHAVLFFALATGIALACRRLGAVAFAYTFVVICLPRLYVGLHYFTDVLAGTALGVGIALLANHPRLRRFLGHHALRWRRAAPGSFYACAFLVTYQIADIFETSRELARVAFDMLRDATASVL